MAKHNSAKYCTLKYVIPELQIVCMLYVLFYPSFCETTVCLGSMETNQNVMSTCQLTDTLIYTRKTCCDGKQKKSTKSNSSYTMHQSTPMSHRECTEILRYFNYLREVQLYTTSVDHSINYNDQLKAVHRNSLVIQWIGLNAFTAMAQVPSVHRELRSHKPCLHCGQIISK